MGDYLGKLLLFFLVLTSFLYSQTVYITETGIKLNASNFRYLRQSHIEIQLKDATAKGIAACKICKPPLMVKRGNSENQNTTSLGKNTEVKKTIYRT
jgi:hypothetical protein